jgi:hypothetical protein
VGASQQEGAKVFPACNCFGFSLFFAFFKIWINRETSFTALGAVVDILVEAMLLLHLLFEREEALLQQ